MPDEVVLPPRRYNLLPSQQPGPAYGRPPQPGFFETADAYWRGTLAPQFWDRLGALSNKPVTGYNPIDDIDGYDEFADEILKSRSHDETMAIKSHIDANRADNALIARSDYGISAALMAGVFDPVNYIPIPITKGIGFMKGAAVGGVSNMAITAAAETARLAVDPTMQPEEMLYSVGIAGLLGTGFGGLSGRWGYKQAQMFRDFERQLSEVDSMHSALSVRATEEGMVLELGSRPVRSPDGTRPYASISDEPGAYRLKEAGGVNHIYDDTHGWILAADRGIESPRAVGQDIVDQLGMPEREIDTVLRVDEARIKRLFAKGGWQDMLRSFLPEDVNLDTVIRHADDLVNFTTRMELWRKRLPMPPVPENATPQQILEHKQAYEKQIGAEAMKEFRASRSGGRFASAQGAEWIMQRLNFSPVAKAMRMFRGDNVVTEAVIKLGGDSGVALNSARLGLRAPVPVLLKAMQHTKAFYEWRTIFDQEYLRYTTGLKDIRGKVVANYNLSAAAQSAKASINRWTGGNNAVMTYYEFSQMVGRAIYEPGDFDVAGHPVNEHARKVAQAHIKMMQEYDRMASNAGLFAEQKSLQRSIRQVERERTRLKARLNEWLYGPSGVASSRTPAIRVLVPAPPEGRPVAGSLLNDFEPEERIFTGETHEEAIMKMIDELGPVGETLSESIGPQHYGDMPRIRASDAEIVDLGRFRAAKEAIAGVEQLLGRLTDAERRGVGDMIDNLTPEDIATLRNDVLRADWSKIEKLPPEFEPYFNDWARDRFDNPVERETAMAPENLGATRAEFMLDQVQYQLDQLELPPISKYIADNDMAGIEISTDGGPGQAPRVIKAETLGGPDLYDLSIQHTDMSQFRTVDEALDYIREVADDEDYRELVNLIYEDVRGVPFKVMDREEVLQTQDGFEIPLLGVLGRYSHDQHRVVVRGGGYPDQWTGSNPQVALHEAVHAASAIRLDKGEADLKAGISSPEARAYADLLKFKSDIFFSKVEDYKKTLDPDTAEKFQAELDYFHKNIHEVLTQGLTSPEVRDYLKSLPAVDPKRPWIKTKWDQMLHFIGNLIGYRLTSREQFSRFNQLMGLMTDFTKLDQPDVSLKYMKPGGGTLPQLASDMGKPEFISMDDPRLEQGAPAEGLLPAVNYNGEIFYGRPAGGDVEVGGHYDAMRQAYEKHGEAFNAWADENPEQVLGWARKAGRASDMAAPGSGFRTLDESIQGRVDSMSAKQKAVYETRRSALDMAERQLADLNEQLARVNERPHRFEDASGRPEAYYGRYWNIPKIGEEREKYIRLFEAWEARERPDGARERAIAQIDAIIKDDAGGAHQRIGSSKSLNRRVLDIPNSWKIEDPEFGTISVSDIIDNNSLATTEAYIRRIGVRIELANMFGDADLVAEKIRNREYLLSKYWDPQTTDRGRRRAMARINEFERHYDNIARSVSGTLRTSDPWRFDNRIGRGVAQAATLSQMGKVLYSTLPDLVRPMMITGIGHTFRSVFNNFFNDMEGVRATKDVHRATGDLFDVAINRANARVMESQQGEVATGGTWFENALADRLPGFFKLSGLSWETVIMKDLMMSASGHMVMEEARKVAAAIKAGLDPDEKMQFRLAAMGINARDALLLDSMPVEMHGQLIQPAIHLWEGPDARQAREVFMRAIAAEARRGIVTPSIMDKSTLFEGVLTWRGHKVLESDLLKWPMMFMSYGVAAHNKVLFSALQGRDRSVVGGVLMMMLMGIGANYLRTPEYAWKKKRFDEMLLEGWESAGIGGFWFGDLNQQIEQFTMNRAGMRPALGLDPKFGKGDSEMDGIMSSMGAAPGLYWDVSKAFWDPDLTASQRAQLIRRGVPYNNVLWWAGIARDLAGGIGRAFEGNGQ